MMMYIRIFFSPISAPQQSDEFQIVEKIKKKSKWSLFDLCFNS